MSASKQVIKVPEQLRRDETPGMIITAQYDFFLSHYQTTGGDRAMEKCFGGSRIAERQLADNDTMRLWSFDFRAWAMSVG